MERYRVFTCPFCEGQPESPHAIRMHFGEMVGGRCRCGAVYAYDETGRMLGEAFVNAITYLYGDNYDKAFSVTEDEYEECIITYDRRLGRYHTSSSVLDHSSKFLFLKKTKND